MFAKEQEITQDLISKKEVLDQFSITYGQFYRWKRKQLIPEAWFIRKSTFTGQETFLPRQKIVERIEMILKLKAKHSFEEIADLLAPESSEARFAQDDLSENIISKSALKFFQKLTDSNGPYPFDDVVQMALLEALEELELDQSARKLALETLRANNFSLSEVEPDWTLWLLQKDDAASLCCIAPKSKARFDPDARIAAEIDLTRLLEETKLSLRKI